MTAVKCQGGRLDVVEVDPLRPGAGQLVLEVQRCGICGSDLHAKDPADELDDVMADAGYRDFMRSDDDQSHAVGFWSGIRRWHACATSAIRRPCADGAAGTRANGCRSTRGFDPCLLSGVF